MGMGLLMLASISAAQSNYELKDSVNVRDRHKMRQWSYENGLNSFPAPRKNNWSLGVQKGLSFISGDVRPERGLGIGINVRKSIGHTLSLRAQASMGNARGLNWVPRGGFGNNTALNGVNDSVANYTTSSYPFVYYNFRTTYTDFNIQGVLSLNNINFYAKEPKVNMYGFAGLGGMIYRTYVDALDETGNPYDYSNVPNGVNASRQDAINSLRNLLDGEFETEAEVKEGRSMLFNRTFTPTIVLGGGLAFKLSRRVDLSVEHRITWTGDDLLDGQRWEETQTLTANADYHQYSSIGINFRIGKGEDALWWTNPLDRAYSDLRNLKSGGIKEDRDSDRDGVPDSRDKEPGTPENAIADAKGRAIDSDGDGFQDFRDAEPFSPKGAQVDSQGKAKDSDNDGVADILDKENNSPAGAQVDAQGRTIQAGSSSTTTVNVNEADLLLPMVNFDLGKTDIKPEFFPSLYYIARLMKQGEGMRMRVVGNADSRGSSEKNQALAKARAQAVVDFLYGNFGISKDRFEIVSRGAEDPLVKEPTQTQEGTEEGFFYLNRRVEFEIIK